MFAVQKSHHKLNSGVLLVQPTVLCNSIECGAKERESIAII